MHLRLSISAFNSLRFCTIIFVKAPQAGFAKTRLIPALGAQGAADLARQMLFRTLRAAIIHCTLDGGYALLGFKQFSTLLFDDMPWSTSAVASMTLSRIGQLGWTVKVGRLLHDVDEPQDLEYLSKG